MAYGIQSVTKVHKRNEEGWKKWILEYARANFVKINNIIFSCKVFAKTLQKSLHSQFKISLYSPSQNSWREIKC